MTWELVGDEINHFRRIRDRALSCGKPMVLWGWKRDKIEDGVRMPESRTVYFSADLAESGGQVSIERSYFFLESRASTGEIEELERQVAEGISISGKKIKIATRVDSEYEGYARLRMEMGNPTEYDNATVQRRLKGKPRISIAPPRIVPVSGSYDLSSFAPFALCAGSGLSAESGLPLLGAIHNIFEVDNMETGKLVFGSMDGLPRKIAENPDQEFSVFCQFTVDAVKAKPSNSHGVISSLYKRGIIKQVFTDNMDDIFAKADIPYTVTRLSIFPDRYPATFDPSVKSLLVVGVAVDRRDVIKQARHAGLKIIAVNPVYGVAPHSRNMDYLCEGDIFYREKASEALSKIIRESGFGEGKLSEEISSNDFRINLISPE